MEPAPDTSNADSRYCSICGYDLIAAPEGICPECGADKAKRSYVEQRRSMFLTLAATTFGVLLIGLPMCLIGGSVLVFSVESLEEWGARREASRLIRHLPESSNATASAHKGSGRSWATVQVDGWVVRLYAPRGVDLQRADRIVIHHLDSGHAARSFSFGGGGLASSPGAVFKLGADGELSRVVGVPLESVGDVLANLDAVVEKVGAIPIEEIMEKYYKAETDGALNVHIEPRRQ